MKQRNFRKARGVFCKCYIVSCSSSGTASPLSSSRASLAQAPPLPRVSCPSKKIRSTPHRSSVSPSSLAPSRSLPTSLCSSPRPNPRHDAVAHRRRLRPPRADRSVQPPPPRRPLHPRPGNRRGKPRIEQSIFVFFIPGRRTSSKLASCTDAHSPPFLFL